MIIDAMLFMADIGSAINHYIAKSPNVLDPTVSAEGATTHENAKKISQSSFRHDAEEDGGGNNKHWVTVAWDVGVFKIKEICSCAQLLEELEQERGNIIWEEPSRLS